MIVQLAVMSMVTTTVVERRQRDTILSESLKRAVSIASSLAALSESYLVSYNFVKLEQTTEQIAAEEDVVYAIVHTHNGQVAACTGHQCVQGQMLDDPISQQSINTNQRIEQYIETEELFQGPGYDVAIPVFAQGGTRKWGTVRIGYSLKQAMSEIRKTRRNLIGLSLLALALGTLVAISLSLRISRPIQQLVTGVNEVTKGNYGHHIVVKSHDEVGYLAARFEDMREALRRHITSLAEEKERLEKANSMIIETQQQLVQSEKLAAMGKLSAKVAHEVNNPLAIIKTSLRIVAKKMPDTDPNKENLDIVEEEIGRIARIMKQLLDSARPTTATISTVQINEVIRKIMVLAEEELATHGVTCEMELGSDLPKLRLAVDQFKQVLLNLIKNAREAMPDGGTLRIATALKPPEGVSIWVIDTGEGIAEDHLQKLFDPFFSTKHNDEGMGLGLSVCQGIIKSFGGFIEVESELGRGTTFHIYLPEYPPSILGETQKIESSESDKEIYT
ncbi:MAG: hypothetical protein ETSY1_39280 [Candidatus Entotheonella factor]|uniref:histidine kinase n=1 Tax=Entotheonella factor TaxID=1429438 RepID=W4L5Q9_ENTF1|nr:MAG: hypothetical protein ETSY1_39280 [Candidatus Entotheonella factor]